MASSTVEEPSQAERLEDVAVAGMGADDKENIGHHSPGQAPNGSAETPSNQSDEVVGPKADAGPAEKPPVPPQAPQRSKGKIALIMGSLMVRATDIGAFECEGIANGRARSLSFLLLLIL